MHIRGLIFLFLLPAGALFGQSADTARVFTQEELFEWILLYHPVARQAALLDDEARANLRMARGYFDPKLYSDWEQKSFGGDEYFTFGNSGLKVPTWYGLELKAAFQTAAGINVDPEHKLPATGQAVLGIKAALGQGMMIDERRAMLQKARIFTQSNEAERRLLLNDLLVDAAKAYWDWTAAYNQRIAIEQALDLAQVRQRGMTESYLQGDKPAIDTLEAYILVQNRQSDLNDAEIDYRNAGLSVSNFLWWENDTPLELTGRLRPPLLDDADAALPLPPVETFVDMAALQHPLLRFYQLKVSGLEVDRRLAAEQLKPRLDAEYNFLGNGTNFLYAPMSDDNTLSNLFLQNYKWGLHFSMPIFLRKERGKLELTRLKIQDTGLELQQKQLEIANKVRQYYNDLENTRRQLVLLNEMTDNYRRMLDAEVTRFQLGESSIFLINAREQSLVQAQLKLLKLQADFQKQQVYLAWATGVL
jgi:outer membrane protein TolC